jgi:aminopeptidase-like protein
MTYQEWFDIHAIKHKNIIDKLLTQQFTKEQIIEYFEFSNMAKHEKEFCLLYEEPKKCHDIPYLNCYFCACPHFRFKNEGIEKIENKTKYSFCAIDAKDGKLATYGDAIHQDCSNCTVPHTKKYIEQKFDLDWKNAMKECGL